MKTENNILQFKIEQLEQNIKDLAKGNIKETWLDSQDVKKIFRISERTLVRLRKKDALPFFKVGSKYLYPESYFTKSLREKLVNKHLL